LSDDDFDGDTMKRGDDDDDDDDDDKINRGDDSPQYQRPRL